MENFQSIIQVMRLTRKNTIMVKQMKANGNRGTPKNSNVREFYLTMYSPHLKSLFKQVYIIDISDYENGSWIIVLVHHYLKETDHCGFQLFIVSSCVLFETHQSSSTKVIYFLLM